MNSARRARAIAVAIVAATAMAIISTMLWRGVAQRNIHIDPDRSKYPLVGADLSAHNGAIDFDTLSQYVDFVYLKATEGQDFTDRRFHANHREARRTGIPVGAYHFFRFGADGLLQAQNLLAAIDGLEMDLPLAVDVEEYGNTADVPTETVVSRLRAMVNHLATNGHRVIIYTNKTGYGRFVRRNFDDADIWICSFTDPPLGNRVPWKLWQHSHCGTLPGINGKVDLNTFNGGNVEFALFLNN